MRKVPEPLYNRILKLSLRIANAVETGDSRARRGAYRGLRTLYRGRLGQPDPYLTETLADFTMGSRTAAKLYRLAISQSPEFPDEGIHTRQIRLARASLDIGHSSETAALLQAARLAAIEQNDASTLAEIDALQNAPSQAN